MTFVLRTLLIALGYAVLGWLGLALALPPGYASPLFPAAGFAIALTLTRGVRALPGVWLGSLAVNLFVAAQHGSVSPTGTLVAVMVASGSVLQAWVACRLVTRWRGDRWRLMETELDIVLFLAIAAPLSCIVSATVGVGTLAIMQIVPQGELLFSWWNWWIGDTLGVLIFTPLTLIFLLRAEQPWKDRQLTIALPMLISLCLVTALFLGVARWEQKQLQEEINDHGQRLAHLLDRRFLAHQEALSALRRLIEVTPDMTFETFEYFTRITLRDNRDIFALSYNPLIHDQARQAFEQAAARRSGTAGFRITERNSAKQLVPATRRPYYVAVEYIAPLAGNLPAIGFDINSDPIRRAAIDKARQTGAPAVTAPIQLVQENRQRVGLLLMHPAHRYLAAAPASAAPELIGFAVAVLKVDELVEIATRNQIPKGIAILLTDQAAAADRQLLYRSVNGQTRLEKRFHWQTQLMMADRQWNLAVLPTSEYVHQHRSWLAWGIGIVGLFYAALLQVMMLAMTGRTSVIQRQVHEQTQELTQAKQQLLELNRSLQQRVDEAIAELRQKDQVLISQGRQAAMGEMIGNIAHQWRQPLNALSMLISNLQFAQMNDELTEEYLNESAATADRLIKKMSTTINDFRNFFNPDKEKVPFSARQQILQSVELVEVAFKSHNIAITVEEGADLQLSGYPNEYSQVLLNLLSNAKDAILSRQIPQGRVVIRLEEQQGLGVVTVEDNGGGVPDEISDKIFEPYFSTKPMGTGIGLYMSKMIIERNMHGRLFLRSIAGGSAFEITVSLEGGQV